MNDLEFKQRVTINPYDDGEDLKSAISENAEYQKFSDEMQAFDKSLHSALADGVNPPGSLKQRLLDRQPSNFSELAEQVTTITSGTSYKLRWISSIAMAACLVVALAVGFTVLPNKEAEGFEQEIFSHIYRELNFLSSTDHVPVEIVNSKMVTTVGSSLEQSPDINQLDFKVADDCRIAKQLSLHMVVKGHHGAVTVLVIPNKPLQDEMNISDDRFDGVISPTPGGNLVVVGEKQESVGEVSNLIARNMKW